MAFRPIAHAYAPGGYRNRARSPKAGAHSQARFQQKTETGTTMRIKVSDLPSRLHGRDSEIAGGWEVAGWARSVKISRSLPSISAILNGNKLAAMRFLGILTILFVACFGLRADETKALISERHTNGFKPK